MKNSKLISLAGILLSLSSAQADAPNALTIYAYPARGPISWESPKSLLGRILKTTIAGELANGHEVTVTDDSGRTSKFGTRYISTMGHSLNYIDCTLSNGSRYSKWAGFAGQVHPEYDKEVFLKRQLGAGVLFYNYPDGYIVTGDVNVKELVYYRGSKDESTPDAGDKFKPRYVQFKLSSSQCDSIKKMVDFFESYQYPESATAAELQARPQSEILYYSSQIDPFDSYQRFLANAGGKMGGGCAPFSAALVKVADLFSEQLNSLWRRKIDISEKLIGGKLNLETREIDLSAPSDNKVSARAILFGKLGDHWTYPGTQTISIFQYDPGMIWQFIGDVQSCLAGSECKPEVKEWLMKTNKQVVGGTTHSYSDSYTIQRSATSPRREIPIIKSKTVKIDGIVVQD